MNNKYERYINYIVNDIKPPYFKNMRDLYGLSKDEYNLVLSKVFNEPVSIGGDFQQKRIYNKRGFEFYWEDNNGNWSEAEFDKLGNIIFYLFDTGYWEKKEYNERGKLTYYENSDGAWHKKEYDNRGNLNYWEDNNGVRLDIRNVGIYY